MTTHEDRNLRRLAKRLAHCREQQDYWWIQLAHLEKPKAHYVKAHRLHGVWIQREDKAVDAIAKIGGSFDQG